MQSLISQDYLFNRIDIQNINFIEISFIDIQNMFIAVYSDKFYRIYKNNYTS